MDTNILAVVGTGLGVITFTYRFLRNFKIDVNNRMDQLDVRMNRMEHRMENRMNSLDEKIFWTITGKELEDEIIKKKIKKKKKKDKKD